MDSALRNAKVLVTGGAGFIGSHIVERLLSIGVSQVIVVDSLEFGNVDKVGSDPRVHIIPFAIESPESAAALAHIHECDYVIHLAARKHNQSKHSPKSMFDGNIFGTEQAIEQAVRLKAKRIVFSSSLYAYGRWSGGPMKETETPQPSTLYGISKLAGEQLCAWGHRYHGLSYNILRYFFVYGPRQYPGTGYKSVIVKNFERILQTEPAIIKGDGLQTLDYVYIDDVVDATLAALTSSAEREVFNIGSGKGVTIRELIEQMYIAAGATPAYQYEPADETQGSFRVGDTEKAERVFGFKNRTPLETGLKRTYDWISRQKSR